MEVAAAAATQAYTATVVATAAGNASTDLRIADIVVVVVVVVDTVGHLRTDSVDEASRWVAAPSHAATVRVLLVLAAVDCMGAIEGCDRGRSLAWNLTCLLRP